MPAAVLLEGLGYFLSVFFIHLLIWRVVRVKKEILYLVLIFLCLPLAALGARFFLGFLKFPEFLAVALVHLSLALAYMQTYPTFRRDIPTFRILLLIHENKDRGTGMEEILSAVHEESGLFFEKIDELENDALVAKNGDTLTLRPAGKILALVFIAYRWLLGFPAGAG